MRTIVAIMLLAGIAMAEDAKKLATDAEKRGDGTSSVQAKLAVGIKSGGKEFSLDGDYVSLPDGRMRMRITYGSLATIIDIGISSKGSHVLFPRKGVIFDGTAKEADDACQEIKTIFQEMRGMKMLFPEAWSEGATGRRISTSDGRTVIHVYKKEGDSIKVLEKVIMAPVGAAKDMAVTKVCKYDDEQKLSSIFLYEDYARAKDGTLYPRMVRVRFNADLQFSFAVTEMETNKEYKDDKFVFSGQENIQKFKMADMADIGLTKLLKE